ncbi:MAG: DUF4345 family protein [Alphaproteobacteria bacterium]
MIRAFLLFNTLAFALFGAYALINPLELTGSLGVEVSGRHGSFEMRGIYGGVSLAAAVLTLLGAVNASYQRPALLFMLTYTGGYVFARAVAIGIEGLPEPSFYPFIAFEMAIAAVSALLLRRGAAIR